ncbi:hypothetical protein EW026_g4492 [Hermanssonia centrifuga]|uniref:Uncharacterized protein n=1 Tax=Hermanssonia centrifuga TaxID=98765 RepID=A0A4S4KHA1_9APHY|nr:hypothetical protein EW026_g4492 [Hermanssonia centrifuga]
MSLDLQERFEALQKVNEELRRKLVDAEETLQRKLSEHESDLESFQQRIEEMKAELSSTKRQEKELRAKERTNSTQISALEVNVAQVTKSLENARQAYTNLQTQYTEQCNESQRYRELLLQRDDEFRGLKDANSLQILELKKWEDEANNWQLQIKHLEDELTQAQVAQAALDEQKQENMMLKETIDRMRFEMDEMRTAAASGNAGSGTASLRGTASKSLGAELLSKMKDGVWEMEESPEAEQEEEEEEAEEEDTEGEEEDVIQTIITRTKRKVASRAKRVETITVNEVKEYSDAGVQHEISTRALKVQTDEEPKIITASFGIQTIHPPSSFMSIQTDPEPTAASPASINAEIQTEEPEPEAHMEEDEAMASSSSTLLPPTPRAQPLEELHPHHQDLPPAYNQVTNEDQDQLAVRVANETLKKWHKGLKLPIEPVPGGISEDAIEDWKTLKEELGVECSAIEKLVEESTRTGLPRSPKTPRGHRHRSRFYNIYNTYVYGDTEGPALLSSGQFLFCIGASAAVAFLVGSSMAPQYAIPGGPVYYDRAAWTSFNSIQAVGEGFPGDGSSRAFWSFLGKLGGGAARQIRGWPT